MSLCHSFREMAKWTWNQTDRSFRLDSPFNEESITETILLELKELHPNHLKVVSFSKFREHKTGADWEFWFVDQKGQRGVGWRVQAKRIYRPSETYDALHPSDKDPDSQIQKLIRMAHQQGLLPVYCFYNSVADLRKIDNVWRCPTFQPGHDLFGCSLALAENVHQLGSNKFEPVSQISVPWHCAVCCPAFSSSGNLPDRISAFSNEFINKGPASIEPIKPRDNLPKYVQMLFASTSRIERGSAELPLEDELFQAAEAEHTDIQGIAVLSDPDEPD